MKQCLICKLSKAETEFYLTGAGKPCSYCKVCHKAKQALWAKEHKQRKNDINRAWRKRNPTRRKRMNDVTNALHQAIRQGRIVRGVTCEFCGATMRIEAAHYDYNKPFDVKWLCIFCHRSWDTRAPKTIS